MNKMKIKLKLLFILLFILLLIIPFKVFSSICTIPMQSCLNSVEPPTGQDCPYRRLYGCIYGNETFTNVSPSSATFIRYAYSVCNPGNIPKFYSEYEDVTCPPDDDCPDCGESCQPNSSFVIPQFSLEEIAIAQAVNVTQECWPNMGDSYSCCTNCDAYESPFGTSLDTTSNSCASFLHDVENNDLASHVQNIINADECTLEDQYSYEDEFGECTRGDCPDGYYDANYSDAGQDCQLMATEDRCLEQGSEYYFVEGLGCVRNFDNEDNPPDNVILCNEGAQAGYFVSPEECLSAASPTTTCTIGENESMYTCFGDQLDSLNGQPCVTIEETGEQFCSSNSINIVDNECDNSDLVLYYNAVTGGYTCSTLDNPPETPPDGESCPDGSHRILACGAQSYICHPEDEPLYCGDSTVDCSEEENFEHADCQQLSDSGNLVSINSNLGNVVEILEELPSKLLGTHGDLPDPDELIEEKQEQYFEQAVEKFTEAVEGFIQDLEDVVSDSFEVFISQFQDVFINAFEAVIPDFLFTSQSCQNPQTFDIFGHSWTLDLCTKLEPVRELTALILWIFYITYVFNSFYFILSPSTSFADALNNRFFSAR
jgi:hypothetical protein